MKEKVWMVCGVVMFMMILNSSVVMCVSLVSCVVLFIALHQIHHSQ